MLDLRSNHWEERVLKERMKTKDQIRRDAMREQRAQQSGAQNFFAQTEIAGQRPSCAEPRDTIAGRMGVLRCSDGVRGWAPEAMQAWSVSGTSRL